VAKFRINAERMLLPQRIDAAVDMLLKLDDVENVAELVRLVSLRNGV